MQVLLGEFTKLPLLPIEEYRPYGDPLPNEFLGNNYPTLFDVLAFKRKLFQELTSHKEFSASSGDIGEARAICRIAGFGRLLCRGLIPTGSQDTNQFNKDFPKIIDRISKFKELDLLMGIHFWTQDSSIFLYPIEDSKFCRLHVTPGRAVEGHAPHVSYGATDQIKTLLEQALILNPATCELWVLDNLGRTIPSGLAQFEMMLFTLANEAGLAPLGEPEIVSDCPHALFEITGDSYASIRLTGEGLSVSLCNLTKKQVDIIEDFSKKTRFLHNHTSENSSITWIIPHSEPTKESTPTGRGLDLGSETMVRIAQVILKLQRQESFDRLFNHD